MFVPSKLHHRSCLVSHESFVPESFGVLCWNVHKNNTKKSGFKYYIKNIEKRCNFFLLQEANFQDDKHFVLPQYSFDAAANLEFRDTFFGVLTASRVKSLSAKAYLSEGKESIWGPHKSLLMTLYPFEDGSTLLILNVHAINFRTNSHFNRELERFLVLLADFKGAMIVAGDFNTWNKKRMHTLHSLRAKLGLEMVPFEKSNKVKSFMGNHLDFIFYRGVELVEFSADTEHALSDHHPLYARFVKIV
jgi:endonuclease/exonuclease/phosphatase (EEP) superfamily protein YafD